MPPRKSVAAAAPAETIAGPRQSLKRKSLSTTALEQVEALLPSSCTPGYTAPSVHVEDSSSSSGRRKSVKGKGKETEGDDGKLTEEQKAALLVEVSPPLVSSVCYRLTYLRASADFGIPADRAPSGHHGISTSTSRQDRVDDRKLVEQSRSPVCKWRIKRKEAADAGRGVDA